MPLRIRLLPALALALLLIGVPVAHADTVACGMSVTSDITLTEDLSCVGDGLLVATSGVTIDLGGHTLAGSSNGVGIGVYELEATIRNGTIDGFALGVATWSPGSVQLIGVDIVHTEFGIGGYTWPPYYGDGDVIVQGSRLHNNEVAISLLGPLQVNSSEISHNGLGISLISAYDPVDIRASELSHNGIAIYGSQADEITIIDSIISDNGDGLLLGMCFDLAVLSSTIRSNGTGIYMVDAENDRATISGNKIDDNQVGVQLGDGGHFEGPGTVIEGNSFRGNGAAGLLIDIGYSSAGDLRIVDNTFVRNGLIPDGTRNSAGQIVNDGVHIVGDESYLTDIMLSANRVHANADYGIEAEGVIDGGGNVGWGNTNPKQCQGVSCRDFVAIQLMRIFRPI